MNEVWIKLKVVNFFNKNQDSFTEDCLRNIAFKNPDKCRYNERDKSLEAKFFSVGSFPLTGDTIAIEQTSLSDEQV